MPLGTLPMSSLQQIFSSTCAQVQRGGRWCAGDHQERLRLDEPLACFWPEAVIGRNGALRTRWVAA